MTRKGFTIYDTLFMKINYPLISRSLIALLFVVAGIQKLMSFSGTAVFIGSLIHTSVPTLAMLVTVLIIIVEIPVALAYAWGYRVCLTGMTLIGFTVIATILVHNNLPQDMVMILKNLAIIGGILATTGICSCDRCSVLNPKK
jgi:putative oxidoreductase